MKSILFQVGIEWHINIASAVQKEFQLPIIAIVESQMMYDILTNSEVFQAEKIYSFPEFYKKRGYEISSLSTSDVISKINFFEEKWNIRSTARYIYCDRYLSEAGGYTETLKNVYCICCLLKQ